ncbi:MAG: hypothetical protein HND39_01075 [Ignavibacteriota bacterium]|nr:MAG: hypothetical protein EDM72_07775 [Chlorobiota bacterium]MBE7477419.1 hypothetical protein [Ignavibacteriales bacterium]MBL1122820.1 hypothetical protein [Ignavibacteriota bacterium]GJQ40908.1 MAG: hypothetical protein JETCAE03_04060 [Ignavibacteriaceae bacterium]QKJ94964.1 MAG: hypothetical protein HND39_01075 [Ignavibacteriota bacterium]
MIPELRKKFNQEFTQKKYDAFLKDINTSLKYPSDFRISETPLFLSDELIAKLLKACNELCMQVTSSEFKVKMRDAVPPHLNIPGETDHPELFVFDFAICKNEKDGFYPKLIELQGFPTLYGYQYFLERKIRNHFDIPENFTTYFNGITPEKYIEMLREVIVADADPANVILLEIEPEKQKTRIDFAATEKLIGVSEVCISDLIKRGNKLFYKKNKKEIPIERIYNRVIFDELSRTEKNFNFDLQEELNVTWVPHPNWFYKISKYSLPVLKGEYVPKCFYLRNLTTYPADLENYVLKPLFSFAGLGVKVDVTKQMLDEIKDPENYILQEKVEYAPLIETPDEKAKVEIRMMYLYDKVPILVNNLIRQSKGKMMGVDFNKNKTWVGGSAALHKM